MSIFTEVKAQISARKVAEFYGLKVGRNGLVCCPFHDDKHPSMKIDQYYYCFGCGAKGDAVNYVTAMYGLTPYESARKIVDDFHIQIETEQKQDNAARMRALEKAEKVEQEKKRIIRIQKQFQEWCNKKIDVLKTCVEIIESTKIMLKNKPPEDILNSEDFAILLHVEPIVNY